MPKRTYEQRIISIDTETTGLDLHHGAKPYLVTIAHNDNTVAWWEWDVDPLTREPIVPPQDLREIQEEVDTADLIVLQNTKFDYQALQTVFRGEFCWDWSKIRDTLLAGHLLASNQPHDLTTMCLVYLGVNIARYDEDLKQACQDARRLAKHKYPDWALATQGREDMPSARDSVWKFDAWLPRAIAQRQNYDPSHDWWTVCSDYANSDSAHTLQLWLAQESLIQQRKLDRLYQERLKVLPIVSRMESTGITCNKRRLEDLEEEYREESQAAARLCLNIAKSLDYNLELPKSGNNKSLLDFCFNVLNLPTIKTSKKTGNPSLDKSVIEHYSAVLKPASKQGRFVNALRNKRKRDTALQYMEGYRRFWLPLEGYQDWYKLYPSLNPTGTDTLRWSSSNPNEQNISKQEGFNLRYCFGPAPGREWWALDAKNIELRLPAYESGERAMIDIFERPNDPPYYGSYHLLIFDILHPAEFAKYGAECKNRYASTLYQWTKNFNFADQYGAVMLDDGEGTADKAARVPGAQRMVANRLKEKSKLNQYWVDFADRHGYVETMPDKTVDPSRGYPLLCKRTSYGRVKPTIPLNYHVQGTAMWWMMKAMIRCDEYLEGINKVSSEPYLMVMQVHDELVFDFPASQIEFDENGDEVLSNLPIVQRIASIMELGGDDIGVPTPVSITYHPNNWSEGIDY